MNNRTEIDSKKEALKYFNSGLKKSNLKNYKGAIADFNQASLISLNYSKPYYNSAFLKMYLNDYQGALIDFDKAIEINAKDVMPFFYINVFHNRGNLKCILKDYLGAIEDFSSAIELKPTFARAYYKRGKTNLILKNINQGNLDLAKAKELDHQI